MENRIYGCPYCGGLIRYVSLYQYFYANDLHGQFEYQCPNPQCLKIISVDVENIPTFKLGKPTNVNCDGGEQP